MGALNLGRISHRHLRHRAPPKSGRTVAWARAANRIALGCNSAGLVMIAAFVATLFPHVVVGDCVATLLAGHAIREIERVAPSFILGVLLGFAPHALIGFARLAAHLDTVAGESKRAGAERAITAAWLPRDPLLFVIAAGIGAALFAYGASELSQNIHARADWAANSGLRAEAAAECADLASRAPER